MCGLPSMCSDCYPSSCRRKEGADGTVLYRHCPSLLRSDARRMVTLMCSNAASSHLPNLLWTCYHLLTFTQIIPLSDVQLLVGVYNSSVDSTLRTLQVAANDLQVRGPHIRGHAVTAGWLQRSRATFFASKMKHCL